MVSLTSLLAVAPVLANIATALPYLQARAGTNILAPLRVGVYMCVDADWQGHFNLSPQLAGEVSAVGPDNQTEYASSGCTMFQDTGCKGEYMANIAYPGVPNLAQAPPAGAYNDYFHAYICY